MRASPRVPARAALASSIFRKDRVMRHVHRGFLAFALIVGFASSSHAQTTLRYQFKEKDKLAYEIDQKTKSSMNLMGAEIGTTASAQTNLYWEVLKVDTQGNAHVKVKVTRSRLSLDSLVG